MKVDLLHYSAPPIVGGVESVISHHAGLMSEAGHRVRILAGRGMQTDPRIPFTQIPLLDSRNPEILSIKAELDKGNLPPEFAEIVHCLSRCLEETLTDVDCLIAHNVCSLHKNLALTAALWQFANQPSPPRLILWHHDLAWTTPRYRAELHPGYPWDLLRTDWPGAVQVVVSELRRRELSELLGIPDRRITVVPNGVDAHRFLGLGEQTRRIVDQLDLFSAEPLLLLPVRITPRKNIELALRVLAALSDHYPRSMLVVTGPLGPHNPNNEQYFDRLREIRKVLNLEGRAFFLTEVSPGYLPDDVVAGLYRLADALFLPSREEGFGIPVLEAALAGLPLFCADIQPLRSLAGEHAVYFSPDASPQSVAAQVVERLVNDPIFSMRVHARQNYSWEQIYQRSIAPLLE